MMKKIHFILFGISLLFYKSANGAVTLNPRMGFAPPDTSKIFSDITDTIGLKKILNDSSLLISIVGVPDTSANSNQFPFPGRASLNDLQQDFFHQFILHRKSEAFKIIYQLRSLTYINLSHLDLKMLPPGLDNLQNLTFLKICYTNLTQIPVEVSSLKKLKELAMYTNNIKQIPDDFEWPDSLSLLELSENDLKNIPKSLSKLTALTYISFRQNPNLSDNNCFKILSKIPSLESIDFNFTTIGMLDSEIGNLKQLTHLLIGGTKIKALPKEIAQLDKLQNLNLESLDSLDYNSLRYIGELKHLTMLTLDNCNLDSIPSCFRNLEELKTLTLFGNSLRSVPSCICHMPKLKMLVLTSNYITSLPDCLANLSNLKILSLTDNKIDKNSLDALRSQLPNCRIVFEEAK